MNKIKLYKFLINNPVVSQRTIANNLGMSVGSVNKLINWGISLGELEINEISYRKMEYNLTSKGIKICQPETDIKVAVILAAGKETEFTIPRSFINLGEESILERQIRLLKRQNIEKIYVVVGQDRDKYDVLKNRYNIIVIENKVYQSSGSLYSLSLVRDEIGQDFLLLAGDLVYEELTLKYILNDMALNSTVISELSNRSDCVYVNIENSKIQRISKDKFSLSNISGEFIGISKISYYFYNEMMKILETNSNLLYNYEYAIETISKSTKMKCLIIPELLWSEIDNEEQLKEALKVYEEIKKNETN